jgi:adenine-specific DNA-methyltransferase
MKDYSNFSKEELIKEIEKINKQKKFGLVWEEKDKENFDKNPNDNFPILEEVKKKEIRVNTKDGFNFLLEGDNFHSLSILNYTHQNSIDLIYIDPPYNTGAKNWVYNNKFVDDTDSYRHSKWLSMMNKRLKLAKNLLKPDGCLICAIDKNEFARLFILLEEIFKNYEVHCITIEHNPKGVQGINFSYTNEFAFFVIPKGKKTIGMKKLTKDEIYNSNLRNWGGESSRSDAKNCFYAIIVKDKKIIGFGDVEKDDFHPKSQVIKKNDLLYVYPIDKQGIEKKWRYARQSVEEIKDFLIVEQKDTSIEIKIAKDYGTVKTVWTNPKSLQRDKIEELLDNLNDDDNIEEGLIDKIRKVFLQSIKKNKDVFARYDAAEYGTKIVNSLVKGSEFDFPKSLYNTYDCIAPILKSKKDALVLDFFAGSGTTAHSLLLLNKEDNGNRKFILCTNNENQIAEKICYERVKNVIFGNNEYASITNIPANLKYYKVNFIKKSLNIDQSKKDLTKKCTELLCIKENIFDKILFNADYSLFENENSVMGIFYSNNYKKLQEISNCLRKINKQKIMYIFTLNNSELSDLDFDDFDDINIKPIPQKIIDIYESLNEF